VNLAVQAHAGPLRVLERNRARTVERARGRDPNECAVERAAGERAVDDRILA